MSRLTLPGQKAKELGLKLVRSRWVESQKKINGDPDAVRRRLVAQELNTYKREDVWQGTPPLMVHRLLVGLAATRKANKRDYDMLIARYDVSVAFFHAESSGGIGVIPPRGMYEDDDVIWLLNKAMNGTRKASKMWGEKIRNFKSCYTDPQCTHAS